MSQLPKHMRITLSGDKPLEMTEQELSLLPQPTEEQQALVHLIMKVITEYCKSVEELLVGKYSHIKELVPGHLADLGTVMAFVCSDGIVIRYERKTNGKRVGGRLVRRLQHYSSSSPSVAELDILS